MTRVDYGDVMVCTDCLMAHHLGASQVEREPTEREADAYFNGWGSDREFLGIEWIETPEGLLVSEWFYNGAGYRCASGEPLSKLAGFEISDNTCSDHYYGQDGYEADPDDDDSEQAPCEHCGSNDDDNGLEEFSWRSCEGCGSHLGGSRYRLHIWKIEEE